MRELKFRIGGKSSGGFRYLDKGELINLCSLIPWDGSLVAKDHGRNVIVPKEAYIIEQYTGLEDKNGEPIYEGDIVKFNETICTVQYDEAYARYTLRDQSDGVQMFFDYLIIIPFEVIGNIHENPELLKEEEC